MASPGYLAETRVNTVHHQGFIGAGPRAGYRSVQKRSGGSTQPVIGMVLFLLAGCLTSKQHTRASQGWVCLDICTCWGWW